MFKLNYKLCKGLRNVYHFTGTQKSSHIKPQFVGILPFRSKEFATGKKNAASNKANEVKDHGHDHEGHAKGLYHHVEHHHGNPRDHLDQDGVRKPEYDFDSFHWDDYWLHTPKQNIVIVNGQKMIKGEETKPMEYLFNVSQKNIPFWSRTRLNVWGNYNMVLKVEFLFFWIPTLIIFSIAIPCFTMLYMLDEIVHTTMTVKVIGRQWYWIYEVESPPEEDDDE